MDLPAIRRRRAQPSPEAVEVIDLEITFDTALRTVDAGRLLFEAMAAQDRSRAGLLEVRAPRVQRDSLHVQLTPVGPNTVRLDHLLGAAKRLERHRAACLAIDFVRRAAKLLHEIGSAPATSVAGLQHGRLLPNAVLIDPDRGLLLIGGRFPHLTELLVPSSAEDVGLLAPEILRGEGPTRRSDVFALAVIAHEMITGVRYRGGRSAFEARSAAFGDHPPDVSPVLPGALAAVFVRALSPRPEERFATAELLADAMFDALPREQAQSLDVLRWARENVAALPGLPRGAAALVALPALDRNATAIAPPLPPRRTSSNGPRKIVERRSPSSVENLPIVPLLEQIEAAPVDLGSLAPIEADDVMLTLRDEAPQISEELPMLEPVDLHPSEPVAVVRLQRITVPPPPWERPLPERRVTPTPDPRALERAAAFVEDLNATSDVELDAEPELTKVRTKKPLLIMTAVGVVLGGVIARIVLSLI